MTDAIDIAQTGLTAMSTSVAAAAGNIANLDTDGYQSRRVDLSTAGDGQGVQVSGVTVDTTPGSLRSDSTGSAGDFVNISDQGRGMVETSNVDLARETVTMMDASRGFEANAAVILTQEDMAGTILDLRV
jgi:flagellar basal-body rod protein FlgC